MTRPLLIGQCLNAAGSRRMADALHRRDAGLIGALAQRQTEAGADYLDVCAAGVTDEAEALAWLVEVTQSATDAPLSLDSPHPDVLRHVLPLCRRPPLLNGCFGMLPDLTGTRALLSDVSHLLIIALCLDERGTQTTVSERLEIAARLADRFYSCGFAPSQIIFDPLTLPAACGPEAMAVTLGTMTGLREHFPDSRVLCAIGNYGYGLPERRAAERAYAESALQAGADVFLCDSFISRRRRALCRP